MDLHFSDEDEAFQSQVLSLPAEPKV